MRAWFQTTLADVSQVSAESVAAELSAQAAARRLDPNPESLAAWTETVRSIQVTAESVVERIPTSRDWTVFFEYELPRRRKRVDVAMIARDHIIVLEFKVGAAEYARADRWQAEQYALDLRDFHEESRGKAITPVLVATRATAVEVSTVSAEAGVAGVWCTGSEGLADTIVAVDLGRTRATEMTLDPGRWSESSYRPTPSIIAAARDLYQDHDVREIKLAGSDNLDGTVDAVLELVDHCRETSQRGVIFITGAPGAGKTLAGLQVVHDPRLSQTRDAAGVFLSGNRPLVEVVATALSSAGEPRTGETKDEQRRRVDSFIQHAYAFRNEYAEHPERIPPERVILFDEAQRAWDADQVRRFTSGASTRSEPEILLDVMSRVSGWSVVVAMVGGGQEINRGEVGLAEWGRALRNAEPTWNIWASDLVLPGGPDSPGGRLFDTAAGMPHVRTDSRLHLQMNLRSPRAERLNDWVNALLDGDLDGARGLLPDEREFPLVMTRELDEARRWLLDRTPEDDRCGLVASADAKRLRAWGLDTGKLRQEKAWPNWFLNDPGDVRASYQLEVPASNFDCQGLELDWVGVCWGGDLITGGDARGWEARQFRGTRWTRANDEKRNFVVNGYRVLLTRSRRGQVIWVPRPDGTDATLDPNLFDRTAHALEAAGVSPL